MVAPKDDRKIRHGKRFHVKERVDAAGQIQLEYERTLSPVDTFLVRILIAKVENMERLHEILRCVPIRQQKPVWNCVGWVQEAIQNLKADKKALGASETYWPMIRDAAAGYVEIKKLEGRFDGKGDFDMQEAATWDVLDDDPKGETIP
jgi:hypothetical protein